MFAELFYFQHFAYLCSCKFYSKFKFIKTNFSFFSYDYCLFPFSARKNPIQIRPDLNLDLNLSVGLTSRRSHTRQFSNIGFYPSSAEPETTEAFPL